VEAHESASGVQHVAQHSFHHVEQQQQHLDSSPVDCIKWRVAGGVVSVDEEELIEWTKRLTEDEETVGKGPRRCGDVVKLVDLLVEQTADLKVALKDSMKFCHYANWLP
jgi:hypothetical protein